MSDTILFKCLADLLKSTRRSSGRSCGAEEKLRCDLNHNLLPVPFLRAAPLASHVAHVTPSHGGGPEAAEPPLPGSPPLNRSSVSPCVCGTPPPLPGCAASSAPQPSAHAVTSSTNVMSLRSCGARARAAGGAAAVEGQQEVKKIGRSEIRNHETKTPAALGEKGLF